LSTITNLRSVIAITVDYDYLPCGGHNISRAERLTYSMCDGDSSQCATSRSVYD
jgi:hypothetical protein